MPLAYSKTVCRIVHRMSFMGWMSDAFRFLWGLLYWNARKSAFRKAPHRRRCPCQAPSDSGRAFETACEACMSWNEPARFRFVCPALTVRPEGCQCSLDAANVRPFWKRAFLVYAALFAFTWLGGASAYSFLLARQGVSVSFISVACPLLWHRIPQARAAHFHNLGIAALQQGHLRGASINLHLAWSIDPSRGDTALILARIAAFSNIELADSISRDLLNRQASLSEPVAQEWLALLLARGDFPSVRVLALQRARQNPEAASPWIHALIVATRTLNDSATLAAAIADPTLAPWRTVFEIETLFRQRRTSAILARLAASPKPSLPYFAYYHVHLLLALNLPAEALDAIAIHDAVLPQTDKIDVWLEAWTQLGRKQRVHQIATDLLRQPPSSTILVLLSNHLLRHPDPSLAALVWSHLKTRPLAPTEDSLHAYNAFFCACSVNSDKTLADELKTEIHRRTGARFFALDLAESYFKSSDKSLKINNFLPLLPLPLTSLYTLQASIGQ